MNMKTEQKEPYEQPALQVVDMEPAEALLQTSATRNPYGNPVTDDWE